MDCGRALASTGIGPTLVRFETFGGASADWQAESVHPRAAVFACPFGAHKELRRQENLR
jgi:hypothetical protein